MATATGTIRHFRHIGRCIALAWLAATAPRATSADGVAAPSAVPTHLTVGSELDFPPFALVKGDGTADGFTAELWDSVARHAGLTSTVQTAPFGVLLERFKNGQVDVLINLAKSPEREQFAAFTVPHVTMHGAVFVPRGASRVRSVQDHLDGTIAVIDHDLADDYAVSRGWNNRLQRVPDAATGLRLVAAGKCDAMLIGRLTGLMTLANEKIAGVEALPDRIEFRQQFAFAILKNRPGTPELLARLNEGLALAKADGAYGRLYEKWFGVLDPRTPGWKEIQHYLWPVVALALLASGAFVHERRLRNRATRAMDLVEATFDSVADGIVVVDADGVLAGCSRRFWFFGFDIPAPVRNEAKWMKGKGGLGTEADLLRAIKARGASPGEVGLSAPLADGRPTTDGPGSINPSGFDSTIAMIDGRFIEIRCRPRQIGGHLTGRVWIFRDVTARKMATDEIERLNTDLEMKVQDRTRKLELANAELQTALRSRDGFMAATSHELRTPLHGILGLSELLLDGTFCVLNAAQQRALQQIEQNGTHLLSLINDILDIAKIKTAGVSLDLSSCKVAALCEEAASVIGPLATAKNHRLQVFAGPDGLVLKADGRRVLQVLLNLLGNAVKFTPHGGTVSLEVSTSGGQILFAVEDTGIGIPEASLQHLFQPFVQVDQDLSREHGGTGLGLALAQHLVDAHGGRIEVESKPGKGSRFVAVFPWTEPEPEPEPEPESSGTVPRSKEDPLRSGGFQGRTLLVVEDNPVNLFTFRAYLERHGATVIEATDGLQAVAIATTTPVDAVLMDIQLGRMDGLQATTRIRASEDPDRRDVPIIAVTALAMPGDRERCLAAGADSYLTKPLRMKQLAAEIDRVLRNRTRPGGPRPA